MSQSILSTAYGVFSVAGMNFMPGWSPGGSSNLRNETNPGSGVKSYPVDQDLKIQHLTPMTRVKKISERREIFKDVKGSQDFYRRDYVRIRRRRAEKLVIVHIRRTFTVNADTPSTQLLFQIFGNLRWKPSTFRNVILNIPVSLHFSAFFIFKGYIKIRF